MNPIDPRIDPALVPPNSKAVVMGEHQPEFLDLPSVRTPDGKIITRWTFTEEERLSILRGGDIYLTVYSYGPMYPVCLSVGPLDWR